MLNPRLNSVFARTEKANVRQFYDRVGWRQEGGQYVDTLLFDDARPVSDDYRRKCNLRIRKYLKPSGRYFLDLGSGPVPYHGSIPDVYPQELKALPYAPTADDRD